MGSKEARHEFILKQLNETGKINAAKISSELDISLVTIRKDLRELEHAGKLVRVHGGACLSFSQRTGPVEFDSTDTKSIVAKKAASLIKDGEIVFLGSGTTCIEIAKQIKQSHKHLTVVSNNLNILTELAGTPTFSILGTGGQIDSLENFSVFHGDFVISFLDKILVQKAFLTADGVSLKNGYTTYNRSEFHLYESIRKISEEMIFVVEGRKFNKNSVLRLAEMDSINTIVSDTSIPEEFKEYYRKFGKKIYIASNE